MHKMKHFLMLLALAFVNEKVSTSTIKAIVSESTSDVTSSNVQGTSSNISNETNATNGGDWQDGSPTESPKDVSSQTDPTFEAALKSNSKGFTILGGHSGGSITPAAASTEKTEKFTDVSEAMVETQTTHLPTTGNLHSNIKELVKKYQSIKFDSKNNKKGISGRSLGSSSHGSVASRNAAIMSHKNRKLVNDKKCGRPKAFGSKIVGGKDADIKDFPWIVLLAPLRKTSGRMVLMNHEPSYVCGGSIISDKWILTASHCVCHHEETRLFDGIKVKIGATTRTQTSGFVEIDSEKIIKHEKFEPDPQIKYDVGLIKLKKAISSIEVHGIASGTICLPLEMETNQLANEKELEGKDLLVAGWGYTSSSDSGSDALAQTLQQLYVTYMDNKDCDKIHDTNGQHGEIADGITVCAGGAEGEDSCGGDSGGPLMLEKKDGFRKKYTLIGLVSWGTFKCATEKFPGIYTDVASFLPWILDHLE